MGWNVGKYGTPKDLWWEAKREAKAHTWKPEKLELFAVKGACKKCSGTVYFGYKNSLLSRCKDCHQELLITKQEYHEMKKVYEQDELNAIQS